RLRVKRALQSPRLTRSRRRGRGCLASGYGLNELPRRTSYELVGDAPAGAEVAGVGVGMGTRRLGFRTRRESVYSTRSIDRPPVQTTVTCTVLSPVTFWLFEDTELHDSGSAATE